MADALLYLSDRHVDALLPDAATAIGLTDRALRALSDGLAIVGHEAICPGPNIGFSSIFGALTDDVATASQKWVAETAAGVSATLCLNDGDTGALRCVMNARGLTGLRTAAVSGACVAALGVRGPVVLVGTGLQCRWHLRVLAALGWHDVRVVYRRPESGAAVREWAAINVPEIDIGLSSSARDVLGDATVVITMVTRGTGGAEIDSAWLREDALLLPVDFAHCITGKTAAGASLLCADDLQNYDHTRAAGGLADYPEATCATGTALAQPRAAGRIVVQNLGNAACDLMIARHVDTEARRRGVGTVLEQ